MCVFVCVFFFWVGRDLKLFEFECIVQFRHNSHVGFLFKLMFKMLFGFFYNLALILLNQKVNNLEHVFMPSSILSQGNISLSYST
jgi:hypothetical protein